MIIMVCARGRSTFDKVKHEGIIEGGRKGEKKVRKCLDRKKKKMRSEKKGFLKVKEDFFGIISIFFLSSNA